MVKMRCSHCNTVMMCDREFIKCPLCNIGFLIGGTFAETGKSALDEAINSFGITEQDYLDNGLELNPQDFELSRVHPMCRCHYENFVNPQEQTETLSFHDIDCNELALLDLAFNDSAANCVTKMTERFIHTFLEIYEPEMGSQLKE